MWIVNIYKSLKVNLALIFIFSWSTLFFGQAKESVESLILRSNEIYNSNPDSSFLLCCKAEKQAQATNQYNFVGDIALCKARYFILVTDYENAGAELSKGIQFYTQKNDYVNLSKAYSLKSILLERIGEIEDANRMLYFAYQVSKSNGDRKGEITRLTNLTSNYILQKQQDSAEFYVKKLIGLEHEIEGTSRYYFEQNIGLYYQLIGDNTKAIYYCLRAKRLSEEYDMIDSKASIAVILATSYRNINLFKDAEMYALESYQISIDNNLMLEERDAIVELVEIYEAMSNFNHAFDFQKKLIDVDKRINQTEKIQNVKANEYYLNLAEKEKVIAQKENSIQNEKLAAANAKSQNLLLYFVVSIVLIILIFTIFIYLKTKKLNAQIEESKIILQEKNKEIIDSITYAKRIQDAILPAKRIYEDFFKEVFVFYRPKDIVAGDFYWFEKSGKSIFFAVADCTGHGVPGALVSVICHGALNRSVKEFGLKNPADILKKTSELVVETFVKSDREVKDGMDIVLCELNLDTNLLNFSGANRPVWVIRNSKDEFKTGSSTCAILETEDNTLIELRGDKQPIGNFSSGTEFTNQSIQLNVGDSVYLTSDGYVDQFGGDKKKKFKTKVFKEKLMQIQKCSLSQQEEMIRTIFDRWKGDLEQTDDVCVIGVKI